jgi:hypothetical protein
MSVKKRRAAKQRHQPQQDEFAGLKHRLRQLPLGDGEVVVTPSGEVKMSEVLADFVAPYAASARTGDAYRVLVTLGTLAWNASFLSGDQQEEMIRGTLAKGLSAATYQEAAEVRRLLHALIDRRQSVFAEHKRLILGFDWKDTGNGYQLDVASTLDEVPLRPREEVDEP